MTCRECGAKVDRHMVTCPWCMRVLDPEPSPVRSAWALPEEFLRYMLAAPVGEALQIMDGLTGEVFYLEKITREAFQTKYDEACK